MSNSKNVPQRKTYLQEENYSWLKILLDSYAINDHETNKFLDKLIKQKGQVLACHKGCSNCCKNPMVPISELELRGISFYTTEVIKPELQEKLKIRLKKFAETSECPFLIDSECSIYEFRPLACRIFNVLNKECDEKEDVAITRKEDIVKPDPEIARKVAMRFLDEKSYNLKSTKEKIVAFNDGIMLKRTKMMHEVNWAKFATLMESFSSTRSENIP